MQFIYGLIVGLGLGAIGLGVVIHEYQVMMRLLEISMSAHVDRLEATAREKCFEVIEGGKK